MAVRGFNPLIQLQERKGIDIGEIAGLVLRQQQGQSQNALRDLQGQLIQKRIDTGQLGGATTSFGKDSQVIIDPKTGLESIMQVGSDGSVNIIPLPEGQSISGAARARSGAIEGGKLGEQLKTKPKITQQTELAKERAKTITEAFDTVDKLAASNIELREGIALIGEGAGTGPIESFFPSLKASSIKLDNLQKRMGLTVVGSVRFGALSKGELDLALAVAFPSNLNEPELRKWFQDKINAQEKLGAHLEKFAGHLEGGGTRSSFRNLLRQEQKDRRTAGQGGTLGTLTPKGGTGKVPVATAIRQFNPETGGFD